MLTQYAYPGSMEVTQAGNDAQQRVRGIFIQAGLDLVSSQVLPPKIRKQFDRIPLTVRLRRSGRAAKRPGRAWAIACHSRGWFFCPDCRRRQGGNASATGDSV